MTRTALRLIAVAIAVAGVVDPAVSMSGSARGRVAVVAVEPAWPEAVRVRDRVVERLAASYEILPQISSDAAAAVLIGDRYPADPIPDALPIATVTMIDVAVPGVRLVRVNAPNEVPPGTVIRVEADVDGVGVAGRSSDLTVHSGGLEVGHASHRWTASRERWRARVDAVPVGGAPWALRLAVDGAAADVLVDVRRTPLRVMFYEPRPSWAATFIRRALEADGRFAVAGISFSSRGIAARTGDAVHPADPRIDAADVIVVGGLDRLSAADVRALDRFMRERAGAVVLVPDARLAAGPARDMFPSPLTERLLDRPAKLAVGAGVPLQASELLVLESSPAGIDVVAATSGTDASPVVASMPRGSGRLMISGAMDAWRFRAADDEAFDRFWRSAIAALALAAPPPVEVVVEPPLLRPLQRGSVIVRVRSREYAPLTASIDGEPIRLLPEAEAGVFRGVFTAKGTAGRQTIAVRSAAAPEPAAAARTLLVQTDARIAAAAPPLAMLASSHGGIDVTPDRIADLERHIRSAVTAPRDRARRHPMRSAWWLVPFVGCLSVEWWMRRRRGLR